MFGLMENKAVSKELSQKNEHGQRNKLAFNSRMVAWPVV